MMATYGRALLLRGHPHKHCKPLSFSWEAKFSVHTLVNQISVSIVFQSFSGAWALRTGTHSPKYHPEHSFGGLFVRFGTTANKPNIT